MRERETRRGMREVRVGGWVDVCVCVRGRLVCVEWSWCVPSERVCVGGCRVWPHRDEWELCDDLDVVGSPPPRIVGLGAGGVEAHLPPAHNTTIQRRNRLLGESHNRLLCYPHCTVLQLCHPHCTVLQLCQEPRLQLVVVRAEWKLPHSHNTPPQTVARRGM